MSLDAWNVNFQPAESSEQNFQKKKTTLEDSSPTWIILEMPMKETRQGHTESPQGYKALFYLSELNQWKLHVVEGIKQQGIITPRTVSHRNNSSSREVRDRDSPHLHPK